MLLNVIFKKFKKITPTLIALIRERKVVLKKNNQNSNESKFKPQNIGSVFQSNFFVPVYNGKVF